MQLATKLLGMLAIAAVFNSPAQAQTIGGGSGSGSSGSTSSGGSGGGGGGSGASNQTADIQVITTPPIEGVSAYTGTSGSSNTAINSSNFLRNTYGNVYYQGRANAQANELPGGFGQMLYTTTGSGSTGGNIGFAGGTSGGLGSVTGSSSTSGRSTTGGRTTGGGTTTGRTGGTTGGSLGRTGSSNLSSSSVGGQIVPMARAISYQGVLKFQPPITPAPQMHADLRGMLDRSTMIRSPRDVNIQMDGPGVILRGTAQDEDEARMIEGMVRLTPGVQFVTNELQYPRP